MADIIKIGDDSVRQDGDFWCLTDLWRADGSHANKRPVDWIRGEGAAFIAFMQESAEVSGDHFGKSPEMVRTKKGGNGADRGTTWAHWQLALSYAKWLSPAFAAKVNAVYKAHREGQLAAFRAVEAERADLALRLIAVEDARNGTFPTEMKHDLARLEMVAWDGVESLPPKMKHAFGKCWRWMLGDEVYEELKRRNPEPKSGSLHSQWLKDERFKLLKEGDILVAAHIARRCSTWSEFEREMLSAFRRAPIQLGLVRNDRRPMLGTGTGGE